MHPKHPEVIKLRKRGKSYREIAKAVGVSKNSVSRWCKNLKLPLSAQKILEKKNRHSREILAEYNRLKSEGTQIEHQGIKENAAREIHSLSKYEMLLVGAALYWGEGWKKETGRAHPINLANSDPKMIKLFLRFMREVLQIPEDKFKVCIQVHPNIDEKTAINFWSRVTNFPKEYFRITRQISRSSRGKRPKNSLPYGTPSLIVSDYKKFYQIKGWIEGLKSQSGL